MLPADQLLSRPRTSFCPARGPAFVPPGQPPCCRTAPCCPDGLVSRGGDRTKTQNGNDIERRPTVTFWEPEVVRRGHWSGAHRHRAAQVCCTDSPRTACGGCSRCTGTRLAQTGAGEVLAHRMVWSLPTALVVLALVRRWSWIPRPAPAAEEAGSGGAGLAGSSPPTGACSSGPSARDRVLESSLGYFINPLVSIAFGVLLLRERLRVAQWVAVGIGALAVVVMTLAYGRLPWLYCAWRSGFATYGLIKKRIELDGVEGLAARPPCSSCPRSASSATSACAASPRSSPTVSGHTLLLALRAWRRRCR